MLKAKYTDPLQLHFNWEYKVLIIFPSDNLKIWTQFSIGTSQSNSGAVGGYSY